MMGEGTSLPIAGATGPFSPEGREKNCTLPSSPLWGEGARREAVGREVPLIISGTSTP